MKHICAKRVLRTAVFSAIVLLGAAPARGGAADSVCVHFLCAEGSAYLELSHRYTLSGTLPLMLCDLGAGTRYRLILAGAGFERRVGVLAIDASGAIDVHGLRLSAAARNAVLPGWGSAYAGRGAMGASDDLGVVSSLIALVQEEMAYRHTRNRLEILETRLAGATTYAEAERFERAAHETSRHLNVENEYRRNLAVLAGALYVWQAIDPILTANPPGSLVNREVREVTLEGAGVSRGKAFIHSLVKPGRGQFYQGKTKRGVLFSTATLAAGLVALEYQNRYAYAVDDYEICFETFNATDVVSEKERLLAEASRLWTDVEHEKEKRNVSLIVLAGLWGWNIIDTLFPADRGESLSRYSFRIDARGASLAMRF